ncbi:MAG: MerR family DNA-binding protein [Pseudomonadota bacterium]
MNISDAAKAVGLPTKTVRYYSDIGLVAPVARSEAGYRLYDEDALKKLSFVKRARSFGFSVKDCRELLGLYEDTDRSSADVRAIAKDRLQIIRAKQRELQLLHDELDLLVGACKGNNRPDCPILRNFAGD